MPDINDQLEREVTVRRAFSPSAPIQTKDLFAGRSAQLLQVLDAIAEPGQHAVIFGERGVGKTSIASVCADIWRHGANAKIAVKVNCQEDDTFAAMWQRAFREVKFTIESGGFGFIGDSKAQVINAADYVAGAEELSPDHVRIGLTMMAGAAFFFDEFDRVAEPRVIRQMADTIKALSDQAIDATIVLVGVADDVDDLVAEHRSISRALVEVHMPRMTQAELGDIVRKGFDSVTLAHDETSVKRITSLSQGLPHWTHLLAQQAAAVGVFMDPEFVDLDVVEEAVNRALEKSQESIKQAYYSAVRANRKNMYEQVLLACALAPVDERGFFTATGVREPLANILGRRLEVSAFSGHLNALANERGPVLKKEGSARTFRYRFENPIMQPYVVMKGMQEGMSGIDQSEI